MGNLKLERIYFPPHSKGFCSGFVPDSDYDVSQCRPCWLRYHTRNGFCSGSTSEGNYKILNTTVVDDFYYSTVMLTGPNFMNQDINSDNVFVRPQLTFKMESDAIIYAAIYCCKIDFFATKDEVAKLTDKDKVEIQSPVVYFTLSIPLKKIFSLT
jgi:hypothetical protein